MKVAHIRLEIRRAIGDGGGVAGVASEKKNVTANATHSHSCSEFSRPCVNGIQNDL